MSDSETGRTGADQSSEPPSGPGTAASRTSSLWNRLKAVLSLRPVSLRDDLQEALEEEAGSEVAEFSASERAILQNVLKLGDVRVEDVMVERSDMQAVSNDITLGRLIAKFRDVGHSRLPVYHESLDDIRGFVHVKDALRRITVPAGAGEQPDELPIKLVSTLLNQKISELDMFLREAAFVPPSMPVGDLLQSMRASHVHMAIVIDEYGGTDGLVTIEDLLETVVGEIEDEHDEASQVRIRKAGPDTWIADARAELEDARLILGADFDPGEYAEDVHTLGGLVFEMAGHVPQKGEVITQLPRYAFEILSADTRRIKRLRIRRVPDGPADTAGPEAGDLTTPRADESTAAK